MKQKARGRNMPSIGKNTDDTRPILMIYPGIGSNETELYI